MGHPPPAGEPVWQTAAGLEVRWLARTGETGTSPPRAGSPLLGATQKPTAQKSPQGLLRGPSQLPCDRRLSSPKALGGSIAGHLTPISVP